MQFVQKIMVAQSALPALFFGVDALSETGLENWMRLTIYIDKNGQIISANKLRMPARNYPVCIEKQNRKLRIFISKKITTDALLALINHIRILKDSSMELVSELPGLDSDIFEEANYCFLRLGQACLALFEAARKGKFLSHVDFWEEATDDADQLPFEITNLTRLKIAHLDTPTALAQLLQNETANAAFYHFTADHHLALMKLPENMVHPPHSGGGNRPAESCERRGNLSRLAANSRTYRYCHCPASALIRTYSAGWLAGYRYASLYKIAFAHCQ